MAEVTTQTGRPRQEVSWTEKMKDQAKWFKDTADYYIAQSGGFKETPGSQVDEVTQLYGVYHNEFPNNWFTHVTNPYSTKKSEYKNFPAKMRSVNILRTNIDQLIAEYHRRPFVYQVQNLGEDGFNRKTSALQKALTQNLMSHFIQSVQQEAMAQGIPVNEIPLPEEIETPMEAKEKTQETYKDALAIGGQRWLTRALQEYRMRKKFRAMFTDWLVCGRARSYKNIENGEFVYERVDPRDIDHDKSPDVLMIEDGEWVVRRQWFTLADIVDKFYRDLKEQDLLDLSKRGYLGSPDTFYSHLQTIYSDNKWGKIPVYHVQFKGRKKVKYIMSVGVDGQLTEEAVDEDYPLEEGQDSKEDWCNEGYEVWRIGKDIFVNPRAIPVQRNALNNCSKCKLSYNGTNFSPYYQGVFSPMKMGVPFQIMYMITSYSLEKLIAKSRGKIVLMDKNAIPNKNGWDEDKFFYYSEAMGWGLLNRNQPGVDKSLTVYQVVDLSLMKDIKEMIGLLDYFRQQWDITLGFNEQRKGQVQASSQSGATQSSVFQSNIVTDLMFLDFEDFIESDMQGLLDYSKFLNVDGKKGSLNGSVFDFELIDIDPIAYCSSELGVLLSRSPEEQEKLNMLKQYLQPLIQNGMSPSILMEVIQAGNMAELQMRMHKIEEIEARTNQAQQEGQLQAEQQADKRTAAIEAMKAELQRQLVDYEYQWKARIEAMKIQGNVDAAALLSKDETIGDAPDIQGIFDQYIKQYEIGSKERMQTRELAQRERESVRKAETDKMKARTALKNKTSGEK